MSVETSVRIRGTTISRELNTVLVIIASEALVLTPLFLRALDVDVSQAIGGSVLTVMLIFAPKHILIGVARALRRSTVMHAARAYWWLTALDLLVIGLMWVASSSYAGDDTPSYIGITVIEILWGATGLLAGVVIAIVVLIKGKSRTS